MAYDEELTLRLRELFKHSEALTEKKMMGGVCLLSRGNMLAGADRNKVTGKGRFMFRVGKENENKALDLPGSEVMMQGGRKMSGLIFVDERICEEDHLKKWSTLAQSFISTLPTK